LKLNVDDLVTIGENEKYLLLDKASLDDKDYYYIVQIDDNSQPTDYYTIIEEKNDGEDTFIKKVTDDKLFAKLMAIFVNNYVNESQESE